MLNAPNALYKMGMYSGAISMTFFLLIGFWSVDRQWIGTGKQSVGKFRNFKCF